jgi:PTH2 family peptidyl-tRNA hydrolase
MGDAVKAGPGRTHKQVIALRKDLNMRKGKMVAQGAHASMAAVLHRAITAEGCLTIPLDADIGPWLEGRFTKICVSVPDEAQLKALFVQADAAGLPCALIEDSGLTEFGGVPTLTAVAVGPGPADRVDAITGGLPLL